MRDGESRQKKREVRESDVRNNRYVEERREVRNITLQNTSNTKTQKRNSRMRDEESRQKDREERERDVTFT